MDSDRTPISTRRRILKYAGVGLATSLAGCSKEVKTRDPNDTPDRKPPADDDYKEYPEPALEYTLPDRIFNIYSLPRVTERPTGDLRIAHPDNRNFSIEIKNAQTAIATLEQTNIDRDLELRLHIRDANRNWQTVSTTIEQISEEQPETHEVEFDISNITLPRDAGSICELVCVDDNFDSNVEFLIKRHRFVGINHKNGVNWVNSENFNYHYKIDQPTTKSPRGVAGIDGYNKSSPAGYVETRDDDTERTVFLVTQVQSNNELYGVSCHIKHEPRDKYVNGSTHYRKMHDSDYECWFATEISHLTELAEKTHNAITDLGITNRRQKLEALGDLIQMIPYHRGEESIIPPTITLYHTKGDCSNKATLFSGIVENDPWNLTIGLINCYLGDVFHTTVGINVNDLPDTNTDSLALVQPNERMRSHGMRDDYAFFDMTYNSKIGQISDSVSNESVHYYGDLRHTYSSIATDDPPDY